MALLCVCCAFLGEGGKQEPRSRAASIQNFLFPAIFFGFFSERLVFFHGFTLGGVCVGTQRVVCSDLMLGFHQLLSRDIQNLGLQGLYKGLNTCEKALQNRQCGEVMQGLSASHLNFVA